MAEGASVSQREPESAGAYALAQQRQARANPAVAWEAAASYLDWHHESKATLGDGPSPAPSPAKTIVATSVQLIRLLRLPSSSLQPAASSSLVFLLSLSYRSFEACRP